MSQFSHPQRRPSPHPAARLARALSKLGFSSRSQAHQLIAAGRVSVNGTVRRDPEWRVAMGRDRIEVDGRKVRSEDKIYLMLNKPRGLVTTASDEQGRATVFGCLVEAGLPFVAPVGRLDKASEGLLLFTNDTKWAARITEPLAHVEKTYHVQINCVAGEGLLERVREGVLVEEGGSGTTDLKVKSVHVLRQGARTSWLEIVLDEGKNRHIRRLLTALDVEVLRLVRVAIGGLRLGELAKGQFRQLSRAEVAQLA